MSTEIGEQIARAIEANMPGDYTVNSRSTQYTCREAARIAREFKPAETVDTGLREAWEQTSETGSTLRLVPITDGWTFTVYRQETRSTTAVNVTGSMLDDLRAVLAAHPAPQTVSTFSEAYTGQEIGNMDVPAPPMTVTDAMIERAAAAIYDEFNDRGLRWRDAHPDIHARLRAEARAALTAALTEEASE